MCRRRLFRVLRFLREIIEIRRAEIRHLRSEKTFSDELLREKEYELDLEEARLSR